MKNKTLIVTIIFFFLLFVALFKISYFNFNNQEQKIQTINEELKLAESRIKDFEENKEKTTTEIVEQWAPQVVKINCIWYYSSGEPFMGANGSGFLTNHADGSLSILTNKHVILLENKYTPKFCTIYFLNGEQYFATWEDTLFRASNKYDLAQIEPSFFEEKIKSLIKHYNGFYCTKPSKIGDKIIIMGYPKIGSSSGITATEGIISGEEGNYYVTSAKIDIGGSGGIAVSVKDNCIVGIPSAVVGDELESLGRILSSKVILE